MPFLPQRTAALLTVAAALILVTVAAEKNVNSVASLGLVEIEEKLQVGAPLILLSSRSNSSGMSTGTRPERPQARHSSNDIQSNIAHLCGPIPSQPCR
jgi:hypothetical protein